jgi:hypothetical protein
MLMTSQRDKLEGLGATEYATVPLPEPLCPPLMVIHEEAVEAVQAQPEAEVTLTDPVPVPEPKL